MNNIKKLLAYIFIPKGRSKRIELIIVAAIIGLVIIYMNVQFKRGAWDTPSVSILFNLAPVYIYIFIVFCVRRLHDINLSGWHIFNPIAQVMMWYKNSHQGSTKYG